MNPLQNMPHFPAFSAMRPEHVAPAISDHIAHCRQTLASVCASNEPSRWDNVIAPLQSAHDQLNRAWACVEHLHAVIDSPTLRDAYDVQLPLVTAYFTEVSQNQDLFEKYKAIRDSDQAQELNTAQRRLLDNELRDFVLGGVQLQGDEKTRFAQIEEELALLNAAFSNNVLDTMNAWRVTVDETRIEGIPDDVKAVAAQKAQALGETGYAFTLHQPSYLPVMQYAKNRELRATMYRAFVSRASDASPLENADLDNAKNIERITALRDEQAKLLGFDNFATLSLVPKMAKTPKEVLHFLQDLVDRAKPHAEQDMAHLRAFAKSVLKIEPLMPWDLAFVSEMVRQQKYDYSELELQRYFPENQVLAGLYRLIESLYGVRIVERHADTWHNDVRFFEVRSVDGAAIGHFYLDLYARDNKRSGAWANSVNNRAVWSHGLATPLVLLTCNFPSPTGGKPACFTHSDVVTLFHEFGHGLHVLLSQENQAGISGWDGVEWDAVELPSQIMENFCYEWSVVQHMTSHVDSGESLPLAMFEKVLAAKNFQSGMQAIRQLEFGIFDMRLHSEFDAQAPNAAPRALDLLNDVRTHVSVVPYQNFDRMPMSFSHIFAGGYCAGYYSYLWAEVLSADAYAAFEEEGVMSPAVGERFRNEIIGRGGVRSAMENFVAFRGRQPRVDALLRHAGLAEPALA